MPVWWGIFAYMMIVSIFGMAMYKNKVQNATLGPVDDSSEVNYKTIGLFFALATFALLVYFVGQRNEIFDSADYRYSYIHYYSGDLDQINSILSNPSAYKGPLFSIILIIFKHFTNGSYTDWFTFIALIQCTSIALFLYKYSVNYIYSIYFLFTTSTFLWMVNGIRQFLAVTLVLFFVDWIKERKTIPFIIVVIFAYFIHSSAIIWIPIYFIIHYEPWSKKFIVFSVLMTVALFLYSKSSFVDDSNYSYINTGGYQNGVNPLRVLVMAVPAIIAFSRRKYLKEVMTPFVKVWINLAVITAECYIVGMFTSGVMGRMPMYFQLFNLLLLPWIVKNAFEESMGRSILIASLVGYFAYFWYDMYVAGNGIYYSTTLNLMYL